MRKRVCILLLISMLFVSLIPTTSFAASINDTKNAAQKISINKFYESELRDCEGGYEDWYKLRLTEGTEYRIYLLGWQEIFGLSEITAEIIAPEESDTLTSYLSDDPNDVFILEPEETGTYYLHFFSEAIYDQEIAHRYSFAVCDENEHHIFSYYVDDPSSCAEPGSAIFVCSHCDYSINIETLMPHTYTAKKIVPTFDSKGYTLHTCKLCGNSYKDNYVSKKTLAKPVISSATKGSEGITLKWNKVSNASGYYIYRSKNSGTYTKYKTISSGSTLTYTDSYGTGKGTKYSYKLVAYAKENGKTYTSAYSAAKAPAIGVTQDIKSLSLCIGSTDTLSATTYPAGQKLKWTSSKTSVVKISSSGKLSPVSVGTSKITASFTLNGKTYKSTCNVTVSKPSVVMDKKSISVKKGATANLSATVCPADAKIKWSTSDSKIATVSTSGVVTGVKVGTAIITAKITYNGKTYSDTCLVSVSFSYKYSSSHKGTCEKKLTFKAPTTITLTASISSDYSYDMLSVILYDKNNTYYDERIYGDDGVVKKTITIPAGTFSLYIESYDQYSVTLSCKYFNGLSSSKLTLSIGDTQKLKLLGVSDGCKWSSSNKAVAIVDSNGKVTAKSKGTATITCKLNCGKKYTCKITVKDKVTVKVIGVYSNEIYNDCYIKVYNNTQKTIKHIDYKIYQYDNRGYSLKSPYNTYYVDYDIPAHSSDEELFWVNDSTRSAKVKIIKVWFDDGTTWTP